jgi:intracellular septation protein A
VNYKVFGAIGVTLIFTMTQIPLITRYQALPKESGAEQGEREKDGD